MIELSLKLLQMQEDKNKMTSSCQNEVHYE